MSGAILEISNPAITFGKSWCKLNCASDIVLPAANSGTLSVIWPVTVDTICTHGHYHGKLFKNVSQMELILDITWGTFDKRHNIFKITRVVVESVNGKRPGKKIVQALKDYYFSHRLIHVCATAGDFFNQHSNAGLTIRRWPTIEELRTVQPRYKHTAHLPIFSSIRPDELVLKHRAQCNDQNPLETLKELEDFIANQKTPFPIGISDESEIAKFIGKN